MTRKTIALTALAYGFVVAHFLLIPYAYRPLNFDQALNEFLRTPWMLLGSDQNVALVSRSLMFLPLGLLIAMFFSPRPSRSHFPVISLATGVVGISWAIGINFVQLWFPARTVSLNNLVAESAGVLSGALMWCMSGATVLKWKRQLGTGGSNSLRAVLNGYLVLYLVSALMPLDFVTNANELSEKLASGLYGFWTAPIGCGSVPCGIKFLASMIVTIPCGWWFASHVKSKRNIWPRAVLVTLSGAAMIESLHFLMVSGVSQGASLTMRTVGMLVGVATFSWGSHLEKVDLSRVAKPVVLLLSGPYLLAVFYVAGWFREPHLEIAAGLARLQDVVWMPFYYPYYATYQSTMLSSMVQTGLYAPVGLGCWLWSMRHGCMRPLHAALLAAAVAFVAETSKLFSAGFHPDYTDVFFAAGAASFVHAVLQMIFPSQNGSNKASQSATAPLLATQPKETFTPAPQTAPPSISVSDGRNSKATWWWLVPCLMGVGFWTATFPAFAWLVFAVLLICGAMVWYRPVWAFAIIPAALPIFDLAPWSGRIFVDEFDALLAVVLAVAYARAPRTQCHHKTRDILLYGFSALFVFGLLVSTVRGLMPFQWPDANSFNNYYSHYNAMRITKGAVWGLLVIALSKRYAGAGEAVNRPFAWGITLGLALAVGTIFWERITYVGLWDFASNYRVSGSFSSMHVGGAYIECFLAVATPFLMHLMLDKRNYLVKLFGLLLLLMTTYAVMVTFSRNGYFAFGVGVAIVLIGSLWQSNSFARRSLFFAGIVGTMLVVAVPIYRGDFAQARFASVNADLGVRQSHWDEALRIRDPDWASLLFGMGVGSYPEVSYWRSVQQPRSGTFRLTSEAGNSYLTLAPGDPVYLEQIVTMEPGQRYTLKLDIRAKQRKGQPAVSICEKWMLTSFNCIQIPVTSTEPDSNWHTKVASFSTNEALGHRRPVKLSLNYTEPQSTIDIDNVQLINEGGRNLLENGTFSAGLDRWFFVSDSHLQWHIKSLFYGLLFDQGWYGIFAFAGLFGLALVRGVRQLMAGHNMAGAGLASLASFLTVGLFDTLIDSPRFLLLLVFLSFSLMIRTSEPLVSARR